MNALCNGSSDGSATVSSAGGTAPYTYLWDDGQTTAMAGSLSAGSYTVTVTDANGCTETQSVTVLEPTVLTSTVSSMDALCNGSSDGSATVSSAGGTAPYTYLWDDGQTTAMAGSLAAGSYTVTVTDANGCTETQNVTVLEPIVLSSTVSSMNALCNGSSDGSATVSSAGGTAPYTYLWDDGQTTAMAGSLAAGNYTVTVTDANGCTETQNVTVLEPIVLSSTVSSMNALCNGSSDGSATVSSAGGTAPYTYLWDDGQTTAMAGSLAAGNYTVTVTDANGCTETQSATVLEPSSILVTTTSQDSVSCYGLSDGSASIAAFGGTGTIMYMWDSTAGSQNTDTATNLTQGVYLVSMTDANGCYEDTTVTVLEPSPILVTSTSQDSVSCYGLSDGLASIAAFGGTGTIMYMWDSTAGSQNTDTATNLTQGIYLVSMTDANGCYEDTTVTVLEPQPLIFTNVTSDSISCNGGSDGFASASAIGGTGTIMYMWDSTAGNQTTDTAINLSAGTL